MKYDAQVVGLKSSLPSARSVLIALPTGADIDKLASGLALYLSLEHQGKEVTIVCEDTLRVGQAHLFAIDRIKQSLPSTGNIGNLVLSLEGVEIIEENGKLTPKALEKLDWYSDRNGTLNLVFHVLPGQTFQPAKIVPKYQGGGFDAIFVLGVQNLTNLGHVYNQNPQLFSNSHVVNVDYQQGNSNFGQTNIVDSTSSVSEILTHLMPDLGLFIDGDIATNLLAGIFEATSNLTNDKAGPDTFNAVANNLRAGGRKPQSQVNAPEGAGLNLNSFMPQHNAQPAPAPAPIGFPQIPVDQPTSPQPPAPNPVMASNPFIPQPEIFQPSENQFQPASNVANTPSPEERPAGEATNSEGSEFEPDWLTPKIFKGTSIE